MFRATLAVAFALLLIVPALAQNNHAQHHPFYNNWINKLDKGCCNDRDCGEITDEDERTEGGSLKVKIEGEWCPVLPHHYLKRGNVPNTSVSHVCVQKQYEGMPAVGVCARLLCYQPKPGS